MGRFLRNLLADEQGQDIAEYAVMLAVILVLVIGTVRLIGATPTTCFPVLPVLFRSDWPAVAGLKLGRMSMTRFRNFGSFGRYRFLIAAEVLNRSHSPAH